MTHGPFQGGRGGCALEIRDHRVSDPGQAREGRGRASPDRLSDDSAAMKAARLESGGLVIWMRQYLGGVTESVRPAHIVGMHAIQNPAPRGSGTSPCRGGLPPL